MNKNLCNNNIKNIFGEPNKGIHSYRLFDLAVIDVFFTFILIAIIYMIYMGINIHNDINYQVLGIITIGTFGIGIISHRLFCVRTTIGKLLFD